MLRFWALEGLRGGGSEEGTGKIEDKEARLAVGLAGSAQEEMRGCVGRDSGFKPGCGGEGQRAGRDTEELLRQLRRLRRRVGAPGGMM